MTTKRGRDGSWLLTITGKPGCCCPKEEQPGPHLCHRRQRGNMLVWNKNPWGKALKNWACFSCHRCVWGVEGAGRARSRQTKLGSSSGSSSPGVWHCKSALLCCLRQPSACPCLLLALWKWIELENEKLILVENNKTLMTWTAVGPVVT